jgi:hypothetical protein
VLRKRIAFLFVGGPHQVFHSAPIAAELALRFGDEADVACFAVSAVEQRSVRKILAALGAPDVPVDLLDRPIWLRALDAFATPALSLKVPVLFANRKRLDAFDALVTTERTSTVLRRFGLTHPHLIHIPHGAGDRAKGFERRIRAFDYVIVGGEKDRARMIAEGLVTPDGCAASGYVKLDYLRRAAPPEPLFDNGRPTVLYNPHFDAALSSWPRFGPEIVRAFARQDRFNLVVAPHVRLFAGASDAERAAFEALGVPDKIIVDAGSDRSIDMTYTRVADIYLGDVSSQVYEFLADPRPCVFVDAAGQRDWRQDPDFAFWHLGEVMRGSADPVAAITRALARHPALRIRQQRAVTRALGRPDGAAARAARLALAFLGRTAARA